METYRRLILSGLIVVLVNLGASMQIVLSIAVTMLFIKLYSYYQPFEDDYIDVDGEFAQYQLFVILFVTLLIREGKNIMICSNNGAGVVISRIFF